MGVSISKSNTSHIFISYRKQAKGKKINLKYYPGIKLKPGENIVKQKTKDNQINKKLAKISLAIMEIEDEVNLNNITSKQFSQLIEQRLTNTPETGKTSFFAYCETFYLENVNKFGPRRAKTIQTAINKLKKFNPNLTFNDIDKKFYRELITWLEEKGYSVNYVGSIIKDLKRILNYATENEANHNITYQQFKKPAEDVYNIYLTETEIESIYHLDITTDIVKEWHKKQQETTGTNKNHLTDESIRRQVESLKQAKNLFVVGCWTGLRVENYLKIDPEIQVNMETGFLHAIANKNGPKLKIPLHRIVREIYKNEGLPGQMSQQKLNEKIKILGELAEINEKIIFTRTIGGKRKEFTKLKYEMITSHTARRSFASNLLSRGIPKQYIMAVTGHSMEKSFNKYTQAVQKDMLTEKLKGYDVWG